MARTASALYTTKPLPRWEGPGLQALIATSALSMAGARDATEREDVHYVLACLNLSHEAAHLKVIDDVGFSLEGVRFQRRLFAGDAWAGDLHDRLLDCPSGSLTVALLLPEPTETSRRTVRQALSALLDASTHAAELVIAVACSPGAWGQLPGVDGFIKAKSESLAHDTCAALAIAATFLSPDMLTCSGPEDVSDALGDAKGPSYLASALWESDARKLRFLTERDRFLVGRARQLAVAPLWPSGTFQSTRELMREVRAAAHPDAECVFNVSTDFFRASTVMGERCSPVCILCLPDYSKPLDGI